ncbi:MAG: GNAT family N-acetyltransferase [Thermoplasmata archaeon]|nr:MAG: GNAT family N-acetyltransferase [Thermoplasmata archaeon]
MYNIKEITDEEMKSRITDEILHSLQKWFGIEKSIEKYIQGVRDRIFFAVFDNDITIGFLCLKENNQFTAEIYLIGILEEYQRRGIGHKLLLKAENYLREHDYRLLMVKTLSETDKDENYQGTREFYRNQGFYPLEERVDIWGEDNPCLIMVKVI